MYPDLEAPTTGTVAVRLRRGHDPLTLPPLQDDVDGDALDVLFATASTSPQLTLLYAGCRVQVDESGVKVEQHSDHRQPTRPPRT